MKLYDYSKTQNKFAKTERKYQIAQAEGKTKYQNNCRNFRNTKIIAETVEIPNFTEAKDKISLQKKVGSAKLYLGLSLVP